MSLSAGTRLGPYEILSAIGVGGMGEVYRARDTRLDRTVAIKVLPARFEADLQFRERFDREARAVASLNHPHICTIHDVGEERGTAYLVMELLAGETLATRLKRGALPLDEALRIAVDIATALDVAHRAGIVHRDLKPGNIMLTKSGTKLLDFGLAKLRATGPAVVFAQVSAVPTQQELTAEGTILGTLQYMAPEQLEGKDADHRADLWAFGCILFEMLTGTKAFEGSSHASLIAGILEREPRPVSQLQVLTPPLVDHIVGRALAKDPDNRWQSARDLRAELEWLRDRGHQADSTARAAARPWLRLASGLAVLLAVFAVSVSVMYLRAPRPDDRLIRLLLQPSAGTTLEVIAVSPDGRWLAFTAADPSGQRTLWIRALDSLKAVSLSGTEDADRPFWSPDSRYIGYVARGLLRKIPVSGGPPQTICRLGTTRGVSWSRSGVIVFSPDSTSALFRVAADGGEPTPLTQLDATRLETSHRSPFFLPDGRHYLFAVRSAQPEVRGIYVGSLDSPDRTRLVEDNTSAAYATAPSGIGYLLFVRGGSVLAQAVDLNRLKVLGEPTVVADDVQPGAAVSVAESGVLVYDRGRTTELTWIDRNGARGQAVGEFASSKVTLSSDDKRVALDSLDLQTGAFKLWTVDLVRGVSSRLRSGLNEIEETPVWSPDATRIVFAVGRNLVERSSAIGGAETLLLKVDGPLLRADDWSRDGRFVMYTQNDSKKNADLWVMPMSAGADREPFPFTQTSADEANGAFSADGKWVAYDSNESGTREVYVQAFPGTANGGKWQVSKGGGVYPQWRRDGKELFYLAPDGSKLMVVPILTRTTFEAGIPQPLISKPFNTGNTLTFAVAADGQRFLIPIPSGADANRPVTVVVNWTMALKK